MKFYTIQPGCIFVLFSTYKPPEEEPRRTSHQFKLTKEEIKLVAGRNPTKTRQGPEIKFTRQGSNYGYMPILDHNP